LNGIVVVDKPADISSAALVSRVKRLFAANKAGHSGTLDPFATGLMICLLNRATRLADFFLHADKTYQATLRLGVETDTLDSTGAVTATRDIDTLDVTADDILRACRSFEGKSLQEPPAYSAVKHRGTPLYKLARQGKSVRKPARPIRISRLSVTDIRLPAIAFEVSCSGGTYIRTLAADIGRELGCGAHLSALRRLETGGFSVDDAATPAQLEAMAADGTLAERVIPMNAALPQMPAVPIGHGLAEKIRQGRTLDEKMLGRAPGTDGQGRFKIVDPDGRLAAVAERTQNGLRYCCVFPQEAG